jgi:citrate synthase
MANEQKSHGQEEYAKGLEGVVACETEMGYVAGQKGKLVYRGYAIEDLSEHSSYEETAYLLLFGKLPTKKELENFKAKLKGYRKIPSEVIEILRKLPKETHPMASLRTGVSALGCFDNKADSRELSDYTEIGIKLISQVATVAAAVARLRRGQEPLEPDNNLNHTANFLYMATGEKPDKYLEKVMDVSMILHADHGMNVSTFSCMTVISSLSDLYSAIAAGIGSLKGPLHGGANEEVMKMLLEIGEPGKAEAWIKDAIANKKKIMGFGHRVYKAYDPRAKIFKQFSQKVTEMKGQKKLYDIAVIVEREVLNAYSSKGIFPNVDFYSGTIYYSFGIEYAMFTPLFAVSRIAGWAARVLEYLPHNRIFRPRAIYKGRLNQKYIPVDKR